MVTFATPKQDHVALGNQSRKVNNGRAVWYDSQLANYREVKQTEHLFPKGGCVNKYQSRFEAKDI